MEGTAFFPTGDVQGKTKLFQCIESGLPVFSRDVGADGKKAFFACGYEYFVETLYRKPHMRHSYEVLQGTLPTKIFFDLDCYTGNGVDFENQFKCFLGVVKRDVEERWGEGVECHVLDASTTKKYSKHVIFDIFLPSIHNVKEYVEYLLTLGSFTVVDTSVYTNNRSFRLAYSTKMGHENPLLLEGASLTYDPINVIKTMVQVRPNEHYIGKWKHLPKKVVSFTTKLKRKTISGGFGVNVEDSVSNIDNVKLFINSLGGVIKSARVENEYVYFIVGSLKCPWNGKCHKNNNTYFTINTITWNSWFKCSDEECPSIVYKKTNLLWTIN